MPTRIMLKSDQARGTRALLALLVGARQRLGQALERELISRLRSAAGSALDGQVGALAHGLDQARLFGDVLHPGAVVLGRHRKLHRADLGGGGARRLAWTGAGVAVLVSQRRRRAAG